METLSPARPVDLGAGATRDEIIERARAMIPTLRARSKECEDLRKIPPQTVEEFRQAGFFRAAKSKRFGGYQLGIHTLVDLAFEVGRGCGSTAWMAGQWPGHNFMVGYFPQEGQAEYWAGGADTLSSTASSVAKLDIQPEGDGWRVRDTQLRFSSGCDYAEWILMISQHGMGLVPKSDFEVLDDWYVSGLRGTGSKSVVIKDAYIPPHRFVSMTDLREGSSPGAELTDDPYLRAPMNVVLNQLLCASAVGAARGVQDLFEERVVKRIDLHTGKRAAESPGAQLRFGESHAEVEAARMFMHRNCATLVEWGTRRHVPDIPERAALRRDVTYAAKLAVQSTQRLMAQGDASGMFDNNQLGRLGRDVYMAGLQASLTWDEPGMTFARTRWGVTPISNHT
jgi:3-hydroxy-9,10-secoandrosta-1,3,5(10)-triene-9,17-dione monooxygenase